jgi:hypothetical protein
MGDDATHLLLLDGEHRIKDSVQLFKSSGTRVSKDEKSDLEALTIIQENGETFLLAVPSFSTTKRIQFVLLPLNDLNNFKKEREKNISRLLKEAGIKEPNIEGTATINNHIILSNRANNSSKINHLLILEIDDYNLEKVKSHNLINILLPSTKNVTGLSGLTYLAEKDMLLFTASTEDTNDSYSDGTIGESYIGYISKASQKLKNKSISPDRMIPLSDILKSGSQKIESVCIESYKNEKLILHLAADNDNGQSTLFKVLLEF